MPLLSDQVEGSHIWGLQSPYHGRAPGLWTYNYSGGAPLGEQETALIVADVNPIDTNSSKPAKQIENLPLALAAHIPFFLERPGDPLGRSVKSRAQAIASKILSFLDPPKQTAGKLATASSCEIDLAGAIEAHHMAAELAVVDDRCSASLKLRAEGLRISSMQPHAHPRIPVLIDWAFIEAPTVGVDIEVPTLEAFEIDNLENM